MDEKRVRNVIKDELAEFKKQIQPTIVLNLKLECDANVAINQIKQELEKELRSLTLPG